MIAAFKGGLRSGAVLLLVGSLASGETLVTTTADENNGSLNPALGTGTSLREAVLHSPTGTTITFAPALAGQTLLLTSGQLLVSKNLHIDASSLEGGITLSGNQNWRIFKFEAVSTTTLTALKLIQGDRETGDGGAINNSGNLTLDRCELRNNLAETGSGGAIKNSGTLTLTACTLADNYAEYEGGAIAHVAGTLTATHCSISGNTSWDGGAIAVGATANLMACTIDRNLAYGSGGGVYHPAGELVVRNSTIKGNYGPLYGPGGGGIYSQASLLLESCTIAGNEAELEGSGIHIDTGGLLSLRNSIIAGNANYEEVPDDIHGPIATQLGVNLVGTTAGIAGSFTGIVGNPHLSPLANNGGQTRTMLPLPGSPAIDAGGSTTLTVDQRGLPRVVGAKVDIGAVELQWEAIPMWLDVLREQELGQAVITSSPYDIGNPNNVFDGNLGTLYRSAAVNPAFIQVSFTSARTMTGFQSSFSSGGPYQWKVEKADTQADMDSRTGSWAELFPWQAEVGDDLLHSHDLSAPVTARIYKLVVQRLTDNYVHINEWGLHALLAIQSIDVIPATLELPHPSSLPYQCVGRDAAAMSHDITGSVTWSSSHPEAATVAPGGLVTTVATGTTEIGAALGDLRDHGDLTVVPPAPPPGDFTATAFHSTAHLTWNAGPANAAGYVIYRRTSTGSYPAQPTVRVGLRQDHTDHGLTPGETYFWKIAAYDRNRNLITAFAETSATLLASSADLRQIAAPKLLIALYHGEMTADEKNSAVAGMQLALDWYYRNSEQRFFMDVTWMFIEAAVPDKDLGYAAIEEDLRARGVDDGQYDLCFTTGADIGVCLGGFLVFNGTTRASKGIVCGVPYPAKDPGFNHVLTWTFTHEIHHAIDTMVDDAGGEDMLFNHFPWNYPSPLDGRHVDWGLHYDGISQIMRVYDDYAGWSGVNHGDYIEVRDTDDDGMADVDSRVVMDEARFGSIVGDADTDDDGLGDGREYDHYVYTSLDPRNNDSDGDGRSDGADPQPLYAIPDVIAYTASPPLLNGSVEAKWSKIRSGYFFTQESGDFGFEGYANYDESSLYLAFRSTRPSMFYRLALDGSGHLGRFESDVRHPAANPSDKSTWYADVYAEGNHIEISPFSATASVYDVATIPGSQVATGFADGWYTTEVRIPKVLPHGCGYTYFAPDAPVVEGLQLVPDRVFGISVTMSQSSGWEFAGVWTGLFETHGFVDFTLSGAGDLDGDGLNAAAEGSAQTDPLDPDSEGDGTADGWETANGLNPLLDDADDDADGDGSVNLEEFLCGTDPQNPGSRLRVTEFTSGATFALTWTTVHGRTYAVETSETLDAPWAEVTSSRVTELDGSPGTEDTESWTDTVTSGPRKFYRVRLVAPR